MPPSLGQAILYLVGDSTQLDKDVDKAKTQVNKALGKMGANMQKTGLVMTAAVTVPLVAAGNQMINDASDLSETVSKVNVVFEEQAARVIEFGNNAAKSMGMSKNAALSAAGTYGNLFTSMGLAEDKSADMSMNLVGLAADLASFNNLDPTEVLEKLRAGLTGEAEPLKTLGININEAILKQKAMDMGLTDGKGALDAATKAQAAYALMFEQTSKAQGDFIRTSEGNANKQRIMNAMMEDASAKLGDQLLPLKLKLVTALSSIIDKFSNMSPAGQKAILIIGGIAAVIGPLISIIGTVMTVVSGLSAFLAGPAVAAIGAVLAPILPIIAIVAAVIAVIALLFAAWKNNWFGIRDITANVIGGIVNFWNNTFLPAVKKVADFIGNVLGAAFNNVKNAVMAVWDWIQKLWNSLTNIKLPDWMTPGSPTPWENGLRGVADAMGDLDNRFLPGMANAMAGLPGSIGTSAVSRGGLMAQGSASGSKSYQFIIQNPVGETTDDSMSRGLKRLQFLGMA